MLELKEVFGNINNGFNDATIIRCGITCSLQRYLSIHMELNSWNVASGNVVKITPWVVLFGAPRPNDGSVSTTTIIIESIQRQAPRPRRAHERKGGSRFDEVLGKNGYAPQPLNFFVYWMVQGIWVMFVSMLMLFVNSSNLRKQGLSVYDIACRIVFGSGLLIEVVADFQKAKWVKSGWQGFFCDVGLWKYSRGFWDIELLNIFDATLIVDLRQAIPTTLEKYFSGGVYLLLAIRAQWILKEGTRILSGGQVLSLRYLQCKYYSPCSLRVFAM